MRRFVRASVQALHKRKHRGERSPTPTAAVSLQTLECRQLFAASASVALPHVVHADDLAGVSAISFPNFDDVGSLSANGYNSGVETAGGSLVLTDGQGNEARADWYDQPVALRTFYTTFTFNIGAGSQTADGFTFALQNDNDTALGDTGSALGFSGISSIVVVAFNIFTNGSEQSHFGIITNSGDAGSQTPNDLSPIDLHSGDTFAAVISYDGTNLSLTLTDQDHPQDVFSTTQAVDIPGTLGSDFGYVGFTAGTGGGESTQQILSWNYQGSTQPIVAAAAAEPANVITNTTSLGVSAYDDSGLSSLTYAWSAAAIPSGAAEPIFSDNNSNSADDVTATFFKAGHYLLNCTVTDQNSLSTTTQVLVDVTQTATSLRLSPHARIIHRGGAQQNIGGVYDQFGKPMASQPRIRWFIQQGPGEIDTKSGFYTASGGKGHLVLEARADGLKGLIGATVVL